MQITNNQIIQNSFSSNSNFATQVNSENKLPWHARWRVPSASSGSNRVMKTNWTSGSRFTRTIWKRPPDPDRCLAASHPVLAARPLATNHHQPTPLPQFSRHVKPQPSLTRTLPSSCCSCAPASVHSISAAIPCAQSIKAWIWGTRG